MTSEKIRQRFLEFFRERGHTIIPSASLVPENDPTVLFNTAGMQPLVPYLMGQPHPNGDKLASVQKCLRTVDIEDIGDNTHATFFEMLGNWSLGSYFKAEAIKWSYELLTDEDKGFGLDPDRLYITVYAGDENISRDDEAVQLWQTVGIPKKRIYYLGVEANWWPNVKGEDTWTGPTGPSSEIFYDLTTDGLGDLSHDEFVRADDEQQVVEIWNDVFMAYEKRDGQIVGDLSKKNVDTGAGLERLAMVLQNKDNIFATDLFEPIITRIKEISSPKTTFGEKAARIVADHLRAAVFLMADGVTPTNTDRGYVLRRLLRRAIRYADNLALPTDALNQLVEIIIADYSPAYPTLTDNREKIKNEIGQEEKKFRQTLARGLKEFEKEITTTGIYGVNSTSTFKMVTTFGFPFELVKELAAEKGLTVDEEGFQVEMAKHQEISKAGSAKKFKGGLADTGEQSLKYHTATHLLHQALKDVLGENVEQRGSNITPERLRFDFAFERKMTPAEIAQVEEIINQKIKENLPVKSVVLPKDEAINTGAHHLFADRYGDEVSVYYVGDDLDTAYSKEFCGGPHVDNIGTLGQFKITKEEAVAAGIRRIKAVLG
ncbi:MAG: alanine--tRNA ligase [Candidatus Paceibacterota bacterium]